MKGLFKALAILTSFSVLTRLLGFLFRIFLSRAIGPEELGIYQISFSFYMVLETFISSGLPLIVSKTTANLNSCNKKENEKSFLSSALLIGFVTALTLCLIILIFKNVLSSLFTDKRCINIILTLLPALIFSSVYAILRGNLWGHKKYFWVSITEFFEQLFRIIFCVILFAIFDYVIVDGTKIASLSYVFSCLFSAIIVLIVYFKNGGKFSLPTKDSTKIIIKTSSPITFVRVISSLLTPLISIIIPFQLIHSFGYTNSEALSIFGIAMGMTFPLLYIPSTLVNSLSTTLIPELSSAVVQQQNLEVDNKINFAIKFGLFVSFMFIPLFSSVGSDIGLFLYGEIQSGIFLAYSSFLIVPICLSGITISCMNALGLEFKGFVHYAIGSLFLIFSILFLTKFIGIYSLVWGMALCLGIASILNIVLISKKRHQKYFDITYFLKILISSIPSFLITKWLNSILKNILSPFLSLAISCGIGEIFFLLFSLMFGLYNLSFLKFKYKNKSYNKNINQKEYFITNNKK